MCIHIRWRSNFILLQVDVAVVWIWIPNPQFKGLVTAWCYGGRDGGKLGDGFMSLSMYPWRTGGSLLLPALFILVCVVEVGVGMLLVLEVSCFVPPGISTMICCVISDQKQWGQQIMNWDLQELYIEITFQVVPGSYYSDSWLHTFPITTHWTYNPSQWCVCFYASTKLFIIDFKTRYYHSSRFDIFVQLCFHYLGSSKF